MTPRRAAPARVLLVTLTLGALGCDADLAFERTDAGTSDVSSDAPPPSDAAASCVESGCPFATLHCEATTGRCEECVLDGDCPFPLARCDVTTHRCFQCLEESDCRPDETCVLAARRCVRRCTTNEQCLRGMCDPIKGTCVSCVSNMQCPDPRRGVCATAIGQCVECTADADCPTDHPRCDPASFRCSTCLSGADCPPARPYCEPSRHVCDGP